MIMILYDLVIRINNFRSPGKGMIWCTDGSFIHPSKFKGSSKTAYGYFLSDEIIVSLRRSESPHNWHESELYCLGQFNAGKSGYFPILDEVLSLYSSIMYGKMRIDLTKAGLYESCNYRSPNIMSDTGWGYIWVNSEYDRVNSWLVYYDGYEDIYDKEVGDNFVIPFFKF